MGTEGFDLGGTLGESFGAIAESRFDSVMITEVGGTNGIVYANKAFEDLTGYRAEDVLGKDPAFLQGPATDPATIDRLRADLSADRSFEGRTINYRADGTPFVMHWRIVPVRGSQGGGKVTHHVAIQRVLVS